MKFASHMLPAALIALPVVASATTIYKWTDDSGITNLSNQPPAAEAEVSNVQVVVENDKPTTAPEEAAAPQPAPAPEPAAAPEPDNVNALQDRLRTLEQQVKALQTGASADSSDDAAPSAAQKAPPAPSADAPPMYGYGNQSFSYESGGLRFGVQPTPATQVMGVRE